MQLSFPKLALITLMLFASQEAAASSQHQRLRQRLGTINYTGYTGNKIGISPPRPPKVGSRPTSPDNPTFSDGCPLAPPENHAFGTMDTVDDGVVAAGAGARNINSNLNTRDDSSQVGSVNDNDNGSGIDAVPVGSVDQVGPGNGYSCGSRYNNAGSDNYNRVQNEA